ncbi:MAG: ion transporter [Candidatus Omnitrophica bacterium]|nr:ion transporter [Candidatus Omnitrophota bacterium]MBU1996753.1 ion transporter [Candidatus Omnitrophota bacterium]
MGLKNMFDKEKIRKIIFETDTPAGKVYDILLIVTVAISVFAVMIDSVSSINKTYGNILHAVEWFFTILFTIDYIVRINCVKNPSKYARSFFGVVDLLGILPTYLNMFLPGTRYLLSIRYLRMLRIFKVFMLASYMEEVKVLTQALRSSFRKIMIFVFTVITIVIVLGSLMYVIEGPQNGFTNIPRSIYWAIVTLTTVGYGDISPKTPFGQTLAAIVMLLGYSIIVIPTGIVTVDMIQTPSRSKKQCSGCTAFIHDKDATYCKYCGKILIPV